MRTSLRSLMLFHLQLARQPSTTPLIVYLTKNRRALEPLDHPAVRSLFLVCVHMCIVCILYSWNQKSNTPFKLLLTVSVGNTVVIAAVVETHKNCKMKNTLKLDFMFDSMTLVLYSPNENVVMHTCTHTHTEIHAQVMCELAS